MTPEQARAELGVPDGATWAQVIRAHRERSQQEHPDRSAPDAATQAEATRRQQRINEARDVLASLARDHTDRYRTRAAPPPAGSEDEERRRAAQEAADLAAEHLRAVEQALFAATDEFEDVRAAVEVGQRRLRELERELAEAEARTAARGYPAGMPDPVVAAVPVHTVPVAGRGGPWSRTRRQRGAGRRRGSRRRVYGTVLAVAVLAGSLLLGAAGYVAIADRAHPAPTAVTAELGRGAVHLAWTDNTSGESGFQVRRIGGNGDYLLNVGAGTTSARWPLPPPGQSYCFVVRAYRDAETATPSWGGALSVPWSSDWVAPWSQAWVPPWPETWVSPWAAEEPPCVRGPATVVTAAAID